MSYKFSITYDSTFWYYNVKYISSSNSSKIYVVHSNTSSYGDTSYNFRTVNMGETTVNAKSNLFIVFETVSADTYEPSQVLFYGFAPYNLPRQTHIYYTNKDGEYSIITPYYSESSEVLEFECIPFPTQSAPPLAYPQRLN